jgi:hypothetical protein
LPGRRSDNGGSAGASAAGRGAGAGASATATGGALGGTAGDLGSDAGEGGAGGGLAGEGGGGSGGAGESGAGGLAAGKSGEGGRGEAGGAGVSGCRRDTTSVAVVGDAWIDESAKAAEHGADAVLSLTGGTGERRLLLSFAEIANVETALRAVLHLELVANADLTRAPRTLRAFSLPGGFDEATVNWNRRQAGTAGKWVEPGGDVGVDSVTAVVPEGAVSGSVAFDVTSLVVTGVAGTGPSFLVVESGSPPLPPASLDFAARESGDGAARLELEFCAP